MESFISDVEYADQVRLIARREGIILNEESEVGI
jgi:hypothetical protein